jgi:predicted nucleic acid-binding Zn ribbon protein
MNKKKKKLLGLKVGGAQREKKRKKTHFVSWNLVFLLVIFSLVLFSRA